MTTTLPVTEKFVVCASCDASCILKAEVRDGEVVRIKPTDIPPLQENICIKGIYAPRSFSHPSRLLYPQRRVGERGSGVIEMNGAAAHLIRAGEEVIIMGFELSDHPVEPTAILVDERNRFVRYLQKPGGVPDTE